MNPGYNEQKIPGPELFAITEFYSVCTEYIANCFVFQNQAINLFIGRMGEIENSNKCILY